jgi:hypothetical protein
LLQLDEVLLLWEDQLSLGLLLEGLLWAEILLVDNPTAYLEVDKRTLK